MADVDPFEAANLRNIRAAMRRIKKAYEDVIHELTVQASFIRFQGEQLNLSNYPQLLQRIEAAVRRMHATIYTAVVNSIENGWALSNEKNNVLVDKRLAGKTPSEKARQVLYDPNKPALDAFLRRVDNELDLSLRVWRNLSPMRAELEAGLAVGISEGDSAASMATRMRRYLREPDKLFRRVRDSNGKLQLSNAAKDYKPGTGTYRSSYKNTLRLTVTETNMANRSSDHERWKRLPFVIGIEIKLSANHPKFDICDSLVGIYPKDYKHIGFHPFCLCFAIAIMMSDADYEKYEDAILAGDDLPQIKGVTTIPTAAKKWILKNKERINGWSSVPFWAKDNPKYVGELLK